MRGNERLNKQKARAERRYPLGCRQKFVVTGTSPEWIP